ncbi:MAG: D-aminoacyl-tRNA deacylase [Bacteroidota bacterium]
MRALVQRVTEASVTVRGEITGSIQQGLLILLGVGNDDEEVDLEWLAQKIANLRIFNDEEGKMNRSVVDVDGNFLVVSQFTLHASTKKGTRPSYIKAARPELAEPMYERFCKQLAMISGRTVERGQFGAHMEVRLLNDGPVTIWIDTKNKD